MSVWMIGYWYGLAEPLDARLALGAGYLYAGERDWWIGWSAGVSERIGKYPWVSGSLAF